MKIYLISLEQDIKRRKALAQCFPQNYPKMQWIKAINGKELSAKEYFSYVQQFFNIHKKIITPSEVGCTLSHIKALEAFLGTEEEYCLILEDDIFGIDESIQFIEKIIIENKLDGVVLCGGQIPLQIEKYKLYKHIRESIFIVPKFSKKFFFGTCCYIVNKQVAKSIIEYQLNNFTKADCWDEILGTHIDLYYIDVLQHPFEMNKSHIEKERTILYINEPNFFKRIYKQGVFWKIYNRIRNDVFRWVLILKGHKQIHKQRENDD